MIKAIFIAKEQRGEQQQVDRIELVQGKGIAGDRNYDKSKWPGQNVTFIELEEIEKYNSMFGQNIDLSATRRNIVTKGIRLNELVGKQFLIGDVTFKGIELCEPCALLGGGLENEVMKRKDVVKALVHSAGLRADVLTDGYIEVGMGFSRGKNA